MLSYWHPSAFQSHESIELEDHIRAWRGDPVSPERLCCFWARWFSVTIDLLARAMWECRLTMYVHVIWMETILERTESLDNPNSVNPLSLKPSKLSLKRHACVVPRKCQKTSWQPWCDLSIQPGVDAFG